MSSVRRQLSEKRGGAATAKLLAVVHAPDGSVGKVYRAPTKVDFKAVGVATARAKDLAGRVGLGGLTLVPNEPINPISPGKFGSGIASPTRIGCATFGDLHSPRQQVLLAAFAEEIRAVPNGAIRILLALALDRLTDYHSSLCRWVPGGEFIGNTFSRQALPIIWNFAEANAFAGASGDWLGAIQWMCLVLEHLAASDLGSGHVQQGPAQRLPLPDDAADAIVTDPPYYGAVMYADLSDYFYVWLKRTLGDIVPAFSSPLVDREDEIVATPTSRGRDDREKNAAFFESEMARALMEARRVVRPSGIAVVVFAHKSTSGWEAILSALLSAGWVATASWAIDTERAGRTNAHGTAALASSVHIVCRPRENEDGSLSTNAVGSWRSVLAELPQRVHEWMPRLAAEGVVGADAIFACLGPALEIFSRYSRVEKASGDSVPLKEYLEQVWAAVAREALSMIFEGADASGLEEDARLTAMWLWTLGAGAREANGVAENANDYDGELPEEEDHSAKPKSASAGFVLEFDAARKIAQGLGAHLDKLTDVVEVKGDKARLLSVAERAKSLFSRDARSADASPQAKGKPKGRSSRKQLGLFAEIEAAEKEGLLGDAGVPKVGETTLDRVHQTMILFGAGRSEALRRFVVEEGVGKDARYWKLAQSLSALYPAGSDEKRWVDGVLVRKKGLGF
jgi:adenine-specific DNA methylase